MTRKKKDPRIDAMNAYALRIWDGQSISLSLVDRVRRVVDGLIAQGYADIVSPHLALPIEEDWRKWL